MTVAYGLCVASFERYSKYVDHNGLIPVESPVLALDGATSISQGYNLILDAFKGRGYDAVVLMHDDLEIVDPMFEHKVLTALTDLDVALVGVAGGGPFLRWWDHSPIGHQMTDSGLVDFGQRTGDVDMIEGSVMVFSPWAIENLRCDERYTDFRSGWDDVCLHARQAGKRVVVVDVNTHHHSTLGWKSPEVEARFVESERMFAEKWGIA